MSSEAWTGRAGRGLVIDAFWSAWDAFAGADRLPRAVVRAVRYGDDTDTTAAIAGGLAGVRWGIDGIPPEWRGGLRDQHIVRPLVDRLVETDGWKTSTSSPLRVDFVSLADLPEIAAATGRVGLTFLPGKQYEGAWTGKHWRDPEADAGRLKERFGADVLALFVEDKELVTCRVTQVGEVLEAHGIKLLRFPIDDDAGLPDDVPAYRAFIGGLLERVRAGQTVVLACRGGLDRTGLAAGCLLVEAGADPGDAIHRVHAARPDTLTRGDQQAFVRSWREL